VFLVFWLWMSDGARLLVCSSEATGHLQITRFDPQCTTSF
jgi:hypothetical protein